ncbi:MAG: S8 family serine peptidase, partial [Bacteroidetes bacterium]|nr:S8 family serine peptidase [Bacteroidota bacterium]
MKKFLQILFSLLFSAAAFAQQLVIQQNNSLHVYPPSTKILATVANHTIESNSVKNISEQKRFIVELQDTPNILEKNNRFQKSAVSIDKKAFRRKIEKLVNRLQSVVEFSEAISGFSFSATSEEIRNISLLNGVKKIYPDLTVTAQPVAASASLSVSQMKMIKIGDGSGVKVGIIDTGIDYLHDALGRGFGEGYKVCGGYDFVNHDSDPMDDNGHGTHVAGIIGGSSDELQGMAEGVKIYSYKALDQDGSGYVSDVLSAIEQAIKDNVQILNLSLSSPGGDAHDILSEAVNRAVEAGIVVVVAAGNFSD